MDRWLLLLATRVDILVSDIDTTDGAGGILSAGGGGDVVFEVSLVGSQFISPMPSPALDGRAGTCGISDGREDADDIVEDARWRREPIDRSPRSFLPSGRPVDDLVADGCLPPGPVLVICELALRRRPRKPLPFFPAALTELFARGRERLETHDCRPNVLWLSNRPSKSERWSYSLKPPEPTLGRLLFWDARLMTSKAGAGEAKDVDAMGLRTS
jgi:hypothetical protein